VGYTSGALGFKVGGVDAFLRKYDASGVVQWTRQFGTVDADFAIDVTLDSSGNVYVLSEDSNAIFKIRKFNPSGSLLLTIPNTTVGVSNARALQVDSTGNIFVLTSYFGASSTWYARLFKYTSAGTLLASPLIFKGVGGIGTFNLIVDSSNNLYVSLVDSGLNRGAFIRKVTNAGTHLWTQRIEPLAAGTNSFPYALALDSSGNVYVTGFTFGAYPGFSNAGGADIFALKLSASNGARFWTRQFGGNSSDVGSGITVSDVVYVAGYSRSNPNLVGDPNYCNCTSSDDAFLAQLSPTNGVILGIDQ
jgi:Beta-propeller repeat